MRQGTVIRVDGASCKVESDGLVFTCTSRSELTSQKADSASRIVVGDRVVFREKQQADSDSAIRYGIVEQLLERKTKLSRPAAGSQERVREQVIVANIEQLIVVASTKKPPLRQGIIDRFLVAAGNNELEAIICVNKVDLVNPQDVKWIADVYESIGYRVIFTSATKGIGAKSLCDILKGKISAFVGHSGVGKSSLLNRVQPNLSLRVGDISSATGKGKHITSWVSLLSLEIGGYVADTPGIREFGLWDVLRQDLPFLFPEMVDLAQNCRYLPCTHSHEPECAVKQSVEHGEIDKRRYESYVKILNSLSE